MTRDVQHSSVSARDNILLRTFLTYTYLTAEQVCRLYYRPGTLSYVRKLLKRLADQGFLTRILVHGASVGHPTYVFALASVGWRSLAEMGLAVPTHVRAAEQLSRSHFFLSHSLAVNEVLIAGARLAEDVPGVRLLGVRTEAALKQAPIKVALTRSSPLLLVPDAFLDFALPTGRMSIVLELDRGTEGREKIGQKLRAYIASAQGAYQAYFGSESMTVALATTAGEQRAAALLRWCEHVLSETGARHLSEVFLVAAVPTSALDAQATFLAACWRQPFGQAPVPLLTLS